MAQLRPNQLNKYRAFWEYSKSRSSVRSTPPNLQIAKSNICNFQCVYCPDHRVGNSVPILKIEGETWLKLLQLIPRSDTLAFHGVGEFMVDPDFFDIVDRCRAAQATLLVNTNGSICTPRHLEALAAYPGKLVMNFSLDAATPETFLRVRGGDFDRILRNIRRYIDHFQSRRDRTWLIASFVITRTSVHEAAAFVRLAHELTMNQVRLLRLLEYDGLDWSIPTKAGDTFDYKSECAGQYPEAFNRNIEEARRLAEDYRLHIDVPAMLAEAPFEEGGGT